LSPHRGQSDIVPFKREQKKNEEERSKLTLRERYASSPAYRYKAAGERHPSQKKRVEMLANPIRKEFDKAIPAGEREFREFLADLQKKRKEAIAE